MKVQNWKAGKIISWIYWKERKRQEKKRTVLNLEEEEEKRDEEEKEEGIQEITRGFNKTIKETEEKKSTRKRQHKRRGLEIHVNRDKRSSMEVSK